MVPGKSKPTSVDGYLRQLEPTQRAALERLREQILRVLPNAEPCISYSMPAFRMNGKVVAGFLATNAGCSYYPHSGRTLQTLAPQLAEYSRTSGALHFDARRGLPVALVRRLLQTRLAEIDGAKAAPTSKPSRARADKAPPVKKKSKSRPRPKAKAPAKRPPRAKSKT